MRYGRKNTRARQNLTIGLEAAERFVTQEKLDSWNELRRLADLPVLTREEAVRRVGVMFNPEFSSLSERIETHERRNQAIDAEVEPY